MEMDRAASVLHALFIETLTDPLAIPAQKVVREYLRADPTADLHLVEDDVDEETWGTSPEAIAAHEAAVRSFGGGA